MYAAIKNETQLDPSLHLYLSTHDVPMNVALVGTPKRYRLYDKDYCGLHYALRRTYYPNYKYSRRKKSTAKKGSTKEIGQRVDSEIMHYVRCSKFAKKGKPHWMSKKLIKYWTQTLKHTLQVAQLPVRVKDLNCMTQADVITRDQKGQLHMWEVKTGFPPGGSVQKGYLEGFPFPKNTLYNHWELQRHYTWKGMVDAGIEIAYENTHVINIYLEVRKKDKKRVVHVKPRPHPKWIKQL